jgi:hypothetical protein
MIARFHPVYDNPVRMGYVAGWSRISDLTERLADLEQALGDAGVVPAPWEPYAEVCLCGRYAGAYAWAQWQLQDPLAFATAMALFPWDENQWGTGIPDGRRPDGGVPSLSAAEQGQPGTGIGHANWLLLATKGEASQVTRKLMLEEGLGWWETHAMEWLERIVQVCGGLGVTVSGPLLHEQIKQALGPLETAFDHEESLAHSAGTQPGGQPDGAPATKASHGFDKELLQVESWTPDPGLVILPVDGKTLSSLRREILRLDRQKVVLLKAGRAVRSVPWDKVTHVDLFEGTVTIEVYEDEPLTIAGYKRPEEALAIIQTSYKAATQHLLEAVAIKLTRTMKPGECIRGVLRRR